MSLPYKKWTEDEIKGRNVSPEGDYPFKIIKITLKKTKGGLDDKGQPKNVYDMLEIEFEYHDKNGQVKKIRGWIVFMESMDWQFRHLADTTGLIELYDADQLSEHHLLNKTGVFKLGIKEDEYQGEKRKVNFIKDYVIKENIIKQDNSFLDDDIPHM